MNNKDQYKLSIVIPLFNESENINLLIDRILAITKTLKCFSYEVILVDDHSNDGSFETLVEKKPNDFFKMIRLSKNSGSHVAIIAGLTISTGDCAVFLAGDLQDPPELIEKMIGIWQEKNEIIWAVRQKIEGRSFISRIFSRLFYRVVNSSSSVKLPPSGADFALLDRKVIDALLSSVGRNPSLGSLIASLGFRQREIEYVKESRKFGKSKWTLAKKIHAFIDAIVGFSFLPMRAMTYFGFTVSFFGFMYAIIVISLRIASGKQIEGWASLMVAVLVIGGVQMIMLGILGEYLWRTLEEARKKPLFFIEESDGEIPLKQ